MPQTFLSAEWRNLLMANYEVDPAVLNRYLPSGTELDTFNGKHFVSLVGFLFMNTKVGGISFPFHRTFEEVNLRFYVRYKQKEQWKRGVVFIKEIVPKHMITFVANTIYKEKYTTRRMRHEWKLIEGELHVAYYWKTGSNWNHLKATAEAVATPLIKGSEEEFITEHYWGYTFVTDLCTGEYKVEHPQWKIHPVKSFDIHCDVTQLYGAAFAAALHQKPQSVFLAEGSPIQVFKGSKLFL